MLAAPAEHRRQQVPRIPSGHRHENQPTTNPPQTVADRVSPSHQPCGVISLTRSKQIEQTGGSTSSPRCSSERGCLVLLHTCKTYSAPAAPSSLNFFRAHLVTTPMVVAGEKRWRFVRPLKLTSTAT